jgi:hypothetical protein
MNNKFIPTVCGVGYLGEGAYKSTIKHKKTSQYETWTKMLKRCYTENMLKVYPTYKDCKVYYGWLNFQNFAKWYDENYYQIECERMELDKDILIKGNKIYSPEACIFVNREINSLFVRQKKIRGNLPIGVHFNKIKNKYVAQCSYKSKTYFLGNFNNQIEAFKKYKEFKENLIKDIAYALKKQIPKRLFDALLKYRVSIAD